MATIEPRNGSAAPRDDTLFLADTNLMLRYARRDAVGVKVEAEYRLLSKSTVPLISFVTEAETRAFAERRGWGAPVLEQMNFVLTLFRRIPIESVGILEAYIAIDVFSHGVGVQMAKNDLWIAATAAVTGATLLTTDKDFDHLNTHFLSRVWINPT